MKRPKNKDLSPICGSLNLIETLELNRRMGKAGVLRYILLNIDENFLLHKSIREVSDESGYDYVTVQTTFNLLYDKGVLAPKGYCVYELDYDKLRYYMR